MEEKSRSKKYLVLDTNIVLLDHNLIETLRKDAIIVLPETVIAELDNFKTKSGELGFQSRAFGRLISSAKTIDISQKSNARGSYTVVVMKANNVEIHLVSTLSYPNNINTSNDRKIIYIAELYSETFDTTFISNDINCRIQAMSLGLKTSDFKEVEQTTFEFVKKLGVPPEVFTALHNKAIIDVDPSYTPENFNYMFTCNETGQTKLATVYKGTIDVIGKSTETELRKQLIKPIGAEQLFFSKAIQHPNIDLVLCEAKAGTGKTLISLSNALALIGRNNPYRSIIYVRASIDDVEKAEEVGFLSGNEEKFSVYFHPLRDSLEYIVRSNNKNSKKRGLELEKHIQDEVQQLINTTPIIPLTGLGMRGRTFTNSIIIVDEVQGQSKASLQKMLTRVGKDCKVIVIGSQKQIDNPYVTKFNNGLSVLLNQTTKPQSLITQHAVSLSKVVRSPMAEWSENIFSKDIID